MKKHIRSKSFVRIPTQLKTALKLKLFLGKPMATTNDSESADWRVFRGVDGIYAINPNGEYYKLNINANGDLKLYRGKDHIYLGKYVHQGYFEAFQSLSYSSD